MEERGETGWAKLAEPLGEIRASGVSLVPAVNCVPTFWICIFAIALDVEDEAVFEGRGEEELWEFVALVVAIEDEASDSFEVVFFVDLGFFVRFSACSKRFREFGGEELRPSGEDIVDAVQANILTIWLQLESIIIIK